MLTVSLGPLTMAVPHLILIGSLVLAMLTGWWLARSGAKNPESQLFRLLLVAVLVARLAFVLGYFEYYQNDLWLMLDIRDGGFIAWPGVIAALLLGGWQVWRDRDLRKPLGVALTVGLLSWGVASFAWDALEQGTRLPELTLRDSRGAPVALQDYAGKPLVINLWATWCPPCRREMPVLAEAQAREEGLTFLFINQGEGEGDIQRFLNTSGLRLQNVLLDSNGSLGRQAGSTALPTTLFYDADGRQIGNHLGELSRASLARALESLSENTQP